MITGAAILWLDGVVRERARGRHVSLGGASSAVHAASSLGRYIGPTNDNTVVMITQETNVRARLGLAKCNDLNAEGTQTGGRLDARCPFGTRRKFLERQEGAAHGINW